ncbi:4-hydroxy-tetrahydrodipicolinate reductase [Lottiidibacillus patelloidae]|uniref:4-hydroxy-tetrahydrodipicolinate reductase n=1 Tax=Lottiidibacillus patelloidae TaxID=2670334 RepID=A0A263BU68_9BACI|nr:4-hydroxy-tetrahydrodipicolinate reductase [Lottiidibacillus patelloidae]OZM57291.1 4-hydroxy-tetrahydrodipicolinate reductase [Lottiidibacillus patelloidae]
MSNTLINIVVAGPRGKMGSETLRLIEQTEHFNLVGCLDRKNEQMKVKDIEGLPNLDAPIYTDINQCFTELRPDVFIDFTTYEAGKKNMVTALEFGIRPVIGSSGFTEDDEKELKTLTREKSLGAIIAPNFALGAVLMMKFAQMAAKHFPDVEIIEQHHDGKLDAPSGTGIKTAEMIAAVRTEKKQGNPDEKELIEGARGADIQGIKLHSIRLPGLIAHQEVLFGAEGQTLKIRHDSLNRTSFMSGVKLAVETVMHLDDLVYGLENIIE